MKVLYKVATCFMFLFFLTSCNGTKESPVSVSTTQVTENPTESILAQTEPANVSGEVVEFTVPSTYVGERMDATLTEDEKSSGFLTAKMNDNHSITYTISKENFEKFLQKTHEDVLASTTTITNVYSSIKSAEANENLTEVVLTVSRSEYENGNDSDAIFSLYMNICYYQIVSGISENDAGVVFNLKDESNGEIFKTYDYPKDM